MSESTATNEGRLSRIPLGRALWTAAWLSVLFLIVYGGTNHFTGWRDANGGGVGVMAFGWERWIPFVPWFIVPYLSIDLFFVAAPLLCRDEDERRVLVRRIVTAVLVAGACFLLLPLRFSFERPSAPGVLGVVFDWFRTADLPYNQLPSLHMTLRTILAVHYHRHTRGVVRWAVAGWFAAIGLSTVLTYQHHVIDIVAGMLLGTLCVYLFPAGGEARIGAGNPRVGRKYLAASAACAASTIAVLLWTEMPWRAGFLLPAYLAISTALAARGYFGVGPAIYRKHDGKMHWTARVLLAPVLAGQWASLWHYARRSRQWDEITDRVWLGRRLGAGEIREARAAGVTAVLDLTCEFSRYRDWDGTTYLNLPVLDLTPPAADQLDAATAFIREHARDGVVYVHCKAGYSRSAAVVGAYLIREGLTTDAADAAAMLRSKRPGIVLRPEVLAVLGETRRS